MSAMILRFKGQYPLQVWKGLQPAKQTRMTNRAKTISAPSQTLSCGAHATHATSSCTGQRNVAIPTRCAVVILHRSCMLCAPATPSFPRCTAPLQFRSHILGGGGIWCVTASTAWIHTQRNRLGLYRLQNCCFWGNGGLGVAIPNDI